MSKKGLIFGVAAVCAGMFLFSGGEPPPVEDGHNSHEAEWTNQVWIDKIPLRETDKMNIFAGLIDPQYGVFQSTSQWEGDYTVFSWTALSKGKAEIEMMQTGKKHKLRLSVSTKDCGQFDMCIKVKGAPRGPTTYYSMKDWVIEGRDSLGSQQLAERARSLVKQLNP